MSHTRSTGSLCTLPKPIWPHYHRQQSKQTANGPTSFKSKCPWAILMSHPCGDEWCWPRGWSGPPGRVGLQISKYPTCWGHHPINRCEFWPQFERGTGWQEPQGQGPHLKVPAPATLWEATVTPPVWRQIPLWYWSGIMTVIKNNVLFCNTSRMNQSRVKQPEDALWI